jgi:signal transduction histidine kinase
VSAAAPLDGIERTAQAARDAGLEVELTLDADPTAIPTPIADAAFRIVQESVTNVLRHARAHHLRITVGATENALRVKVADDGVGAGTGAGAGARTVPGRGIQGMRERATLLGGEVTAESSPTGFTVDATLPIRRTHAADGTLRSGLEP